MSLDFIHSFFLEEKNKTRVVQSAIWENIGGLETLCLLTVVSLTGWRFHTKYIAPWIDGLAQQISFYFLFLVIIKVNG